MRRGSAPATPGRLFVAEIESSVKQEGAHVGQDVRGLLDPLSELFDLLVERGSFVIRVLDAADQRLAGMFAGAYPVDPFEEVDTADGEFGPVIRGTRHTLGCRLVGSGQLGFQMLVRGRVEALEIVADAGQPLVRYRGRYRKLSPEA